MEKQPRIPLTRRDYQDIVDDFTKPGGFLETHYGDLYVQFRETAIGQAIVEYLATIGAVFNYGAGIEADEGRLISARQTASVIDHADSLGYDYIGPKPATCLATLTIETDEAVSIAAGTLKAATGADFGEAIQFEALAEINKPAGTQTVTGITLTEGESFTNEPVISDGVVGTRFDIAQDSAVILDSVKVLVEGEAWTRVTNFVDSEPADKHFKVRFREDVPGTRIYFIEFGDSVSGLFPDSGQRIEISGRFGGGEDGNVPVGGISRLLTQITDTQGNIITASIVSTNDASGGLDDEGVEDIRMNATQKVVTNSRGVSRDDCTLSAIAAGAKRAVCITKNEFAGIPENTYHVMASTSLGATLTQTEKDNIKDHIQTNNPIPGSARLLVGSVGYATFDVDIDVFISKSADRETVESNITTRLTDASTGLLTYAGTIGADEPRFVLDAGQPIKLSWITDIVDSEKGVISSKVRFRNSAGTVVVSSTDTEANLENFIPEPFEVPNPRNVNITITREGT